MNLFRSLQLAASAPVARERLQILLEYERKLGSQIDLFTALREEILAVVSRHVVDPEKVQVTVDRGAKFSTLGVNIEIPNTAGKARMLSTTRGVDAVAGTVVGGGRPPALSVGALLLAKKAGSVPLITSLFRVGLIAVMVLGAWLYVQQRDVSKRRTLDGRGTALMAGFEEQVNALLPAEGVVAAAGTSVVSPGTSSPGTVAQSTAVTSPAAPASTTSPQKPLPLRGSVIDISEPAPQSAAVVPRTALESAMSPPQEPPPLPDPAAAEPASQSFPGPRWKAPRRCPRSRRHCAIRSPQSRPRNPPRSLPPPRRQAPRYRRTSRCHYGGALLHHRRSHRHCAIGPPRSRSYNPTRSLPPPRRQAQRHRRSRCHYGGALLLHRRIRRYCAIGPPRSRPCNPPLSLS